MPHNYRVGHDMHAIHAMRLGQTPWGWRPGTVRAVDGQTASIEYLLEEGSVEIWHHEPLDMLSIGTPVRIHEEYHALEVAGEWLNVRPTGGLGDVPTPTHRDLWRHESHSAVVTDLSTGRAIAPDAVPGEHE